MTREDPRADINMSGIPVAGIGGLGLVAVALVMTIVVPAAWWMLLFGALGGMVLGAALVLSRRGRRPSGPSGDDPRILFRSEQVHPNVPAQTARHEPEIKELAPAHV